ncbi:hypothetical protein GLYMA_14G168900v4 [Glycine max]|nr:hypothetical protein GLYMA_14G168900v4 [Glycine max]KAH1094962.1 hypothetical protein GYH30_040311 [Glycine max]
MFKPSTNETLDSQSTEEDAAGLVAPLSAQNQVGLILGETSSQIQQQNLARNYDPFTNQLLNDPPVFQGLAISNENHTRSQVDEIARVNMGKANTQIMTSERSTLPPLQDDHTNNSHEAWNSRYTQSQSQVAMPNDYRERVDGPVQLYRAPPNLILNIGNQNVTPMVSSIGTSNVIIPMAMPNPRQNLQIERELRREEPNEVARNFRLREGQAERPLGNQRLEIGEGSSSKRRRTNSLPRQGPNTGLALQLPNNAPAWQGPNTGLALQLPNNAPEIQGPQNQNNNPGNQVEIRGNSLYDPIFETLGLAVDPHIRLFEAQNGQAEKGYYMFK